MESIIQQLALDLVEDWMCVIAQCGLSEIDVTSAELLKVSKSNALKLLSSLVSKMDESLFEAKSERKQVGLKVKERSRTRSYLTDLGWLNYSRSYYYDELSGQYFYPVDAMIGVSSYERISPSVSAALLQNAAYVSMRASCENVTGGDISAQSVCNKLQSVGLLQKALPKTRSKASELHIFADEDHVSLQDGRNKIVPLVTVSEGVIDAGKNRRQLINPVHFTFDISDTDTLWRRVYAYVDMAYHVEDIDKIFIYGDGASWIKRSLDEFGDAIFVLDGFHLQRKLRPFIDATSAECIHQLLSERRRDDFKVVAQSVICSCKDASRKKRLKENMKYVLNQWDGVVNRYLYPTIGSCTEAQVSHVLSERLSRNPMGWSEDGLGAMSSLRVYVKNGCVVKRADFIQDSSERESSKLSRYADEMIESVLNFELDRSLFERSRPRHGKVTPISVILKSLGSIRDIGAHRRN